MNEVQTIADFAKAIFLRDGYHAPIVIAKGTNGTSVVLIEQFDATADARVTSKSATTAFIAACLGKAVDEDKVVHAYRKGRNQLVLFEDVDVFLPVEHEVEGQKRLVKRFLEWVCEGTEYH